MAYSKLQAFDTRRVDERGVASSRGWGVRCSAPIAEGQVVVEVRGRALTELEYVGLGLGLRLGLGPGLG